MKNIIIAIVLLSSLQVSAQRWREKGSEKIDAYKIAYITNHLELNSEESAKFWPIYNEYEAKLDEIRGAQHDLIESVASQDEATSKAKIDEYFELEEQELLTKKTYIYDLAEVIGFVKVRQLKSLERSFKKELLSKMRR